MAWIDKLVGRSPIGPMQRHMSAAVVCAKEIIPLIEAMAAGDTSAIRERRAEIDRLEHAADEIKHQIRSNMPRRMMMAMERRDLLDILDFQDSIADVAQDIAELVDQRNMHLPAELVGPFEALAIRSVQACEYGHRIINELDELVETGFGDREVARVEEMIAELGRIETETDSLLDAACRALFAMESELGLATLYWHQLLLWIADLADYAERVGNRLRLLLAT
jgi:predicted phosphate transport protein (TIGR00153 family)